MNDSNGYIYDPNGINLDIVKDIKEVKRGRIKEYADRVEVLPTQRDLASGTSNVMYTFHVLLRTNLALTELRHWLQMAANTSLKVQTCLLLLMQQHTFQENGVLFMPGKAANAGGVATSALEMSQNSMRLSWTREEVDEKLHNIMIDIFHKADDAAKRYGMEDNYVARCKHRRLRKSCMML